MSEPDVKAALARAKTHDGRDLLALSQEQPVLLVFLRHLGCTFCREAACDVSRDRVKIEDNAAVVFVHMVEAERAQRFLARYDLGDALHVSDTGKELYQAFELQRGTLGQLFGAKVWARGFQAGVLGGHWVGALAGDGFQMPGVFVVKDGVIVRAFRHTTAADRPDYAALATAVRA